MSMLMIFNMVLSTFFHVLSLKYSTLKIFVSVQLVAKVTAFPAMTASPATSMTSYTSTGYGPAAKVPGSPTGSLGGCTSPDRYIIMTSLNWAQCGNFRNLLPHTFLHEINFGDCQNFTWKNMIGRKLVTFHTVLGSRYFSKNTTKHAIFAFPLQHHGSFTQRVWSFPLRRISILWLKKIPIHPSTSIPAATLLATTFATAATTTTAPTRLWWSSHQKRRGSLL